jgi:hypothetical protein
MNDVKLTALQFSMHTYEVRPSKDKRGVDLISDALPFGRAVVWRAERNQQSNRVREALETDLRAGN